jgi:hypothetical protein
MTGLAPGRGKDEIKRSRTADGAILRLPGLLSDSKRYRF